MSNVYLEPGCYLPHKKPMVLIDKVIEVTDNSAICQSYVNEKGCLAPFLEDKELPSFYIIELISQTIGVWSGVKAKKNNLTIPPMGMVIGCRALKCIVDKFSYNSTLNIKINKIIEDDTLASFDGTISVDDTDLGFGTINVVRVTEEQTKTLFVRN